MHIEDILMKLNMSFEDHKLLEKCNESCGEVSKIIKNWFARKPVYNEKYSKTKSKIKAHEGRSIQIFVMIKYQKKALIAFVFIDSVFKNG